MRADPNYRQSAAATLKGRKRVRAEEPLLDIMIEGLGKATALAKTCLGVSQTGRSVNEQSLEKKKVVGDCRTGQARPHKH